MDIGEELLVPVEGDPIFATCARNMNSGEKLASPMRMLQEDHKVVTGEIRGYLDDTLYQVGGAFDEPNRAHCAPMFSILLMLGGVWDVVL